MNCNCSCTCNCETNDDSRRRLLDLINESSFAVYDMLLYLDTHPNDAEAMDYFHKQSCIRRDALKEYARQYGPLSIDFMDDGSDSWDWMMQPWPWEMNKKGGC